jgi:hypothetical protein
MRIENHIFYLDDVDMPIIQIATTQPYQNRNLTLVINPPIVSQLITLRTEISGRMYMMLAPEDWKPFITAFNYDRDDTDDEVAKFTERLLGLYLCYIVQNLSHRIFLRVFVEQQISNKQDARITWRHDV